MTTVLNTGSHAVDQVKDTASSARGAVLDLGVQALKFLNTVRSEEYRLVGSALESVGLQRRESSLRPVLWFAAGAVLAGSAVLLLAPTSGRKLRNKILRVFGSTEEAATDLAKSMATNVKNAEKRVAAYAAAGVEEAKADAAKVTNGHDHVEAPRRS